MINPALLVQKPLNMIATPDMMNDIEYKTGALITLNCTIPVIPNLPSREAIPVTEINKLEKNLVCPNDMAYEVICV